MLSLRLLMRSWRSGELYLLAASIFLAVMVVSVIAIFSERLERSLVQSSNSFIAADTVIQSSKPIPQVWQNQAGSLGLSHVETAEFSSMLFAGDKSQLASVKSVASGYPLRGEVEVSVIPFSVDKTTIAVAEEVPSAGEIWVESRLFPLLDLQIGSEVFVGEKALRVSKVIIKEPDRGMGFSLFGARVLMNSADLPATQVIQPGSRIRYKLLLAGPEEGLQSFLNKIGPELSEHEKIVQLEDSQARLSKNLDTGKKFLLLAGVIGLLLAGVAIGISAQQFAQRNIERVALLKSMGAGQWSIRRLYVLQMIVLAAIFSAIGLFVGSMIVNGLVYSLAKMLNMEFLPAYSTTYALCFFSGIFALLFFALPSLWYLPSVPPIKILRAEMAPPDLSQKAKLVLGSLGIFVYVLMFSRDAQLTLIILFGLLAILGTVYLVAVFLVGVGKASLHNVGREVRLAIANVIRYRQRTLLQVVVFSFAFMLLFLLLLIRTSLVKEWQLQLPEHAPNHFLVNIAPSEVEPVKALVEEYELLPEQLYPMVRARLTHVEGVPIAEKFEEIPGSLNREVNLTWSSILADDNKILAGDWWPTWNKRTNAKAGVSVEAEVAEELGIEIGDRLLFSVGGLPLDAEVASIRSLDWDSMRPNFYFVFSPNALDSYSPSFITSIYIPAEKKALVNELFKRFPTLLVIELDVVIERIKTIVSQLTQAVGLVLGLVWLGGLLVMFTLISISMDTRRHEAGVLRAFGASKALMQKSLWVEFCFIGFVSAVIAALSSEIILLVLQIYVFDFPARIHPWMWAVGIPAATLFIGYVGMKSCRKILTTPPSVVLRG